MQPQFEILTAFNQTTVDLIGLNGKPDRFNGMADFAYLEHPHDPGRAFQGDSLSDFLSKLKLNPDEKDLYLPPPIFSDVDHPKEYHFRSNPYFRDEVDAASTQVDDGSTCQRLSLSCVRNLCTAS